MACGDFPRWPLAVNWGFLRCEVGPDETERVVFSTPAGRDYAVNVAARTVGYADIGAILDRRVAKGDAEWALEPLATAGLALCA